MSNTSAIAEPTTDDFTVLTTNFSCEKGADGSVIVKDVPIFGENERKSFAGDLKYDEKWLKSAADVDAKLRKGDYKAPMHFGHHTGFGGQIERAGHYEITGVKKVKLHDKKMHVAFANLVFKDEAAYEKYRKDYPYRSVEISHERPEQINSLALLSAEAPYFQFPIGNHQFATEIGTEQPKAHYFTWKAEVAETFAGFPPKKAGAAPKYGEDTDGDGEADEGVSDGANGMAADGQQAPPQPGQNSQGQQGTNQNDVVVATLNAMMELLNKLVDHTLKKDGADKDTLEQDEDEDDGEDTAETDDDGDDDEMSDKKKDQPIVAASADVAALQGKVAALEAELARVTKERADEVAFATLKTELAPYGIANLDEEIKKHIASGTAQAWASGVKQIAPRQADQPQTRVEDPAVAEFLKKNPKADPVVVRRLAADFAAAPEGHMVRKYPLDRYLAVQLEMGS